MPIIKHFFIFFLTLIFINIFSFVYCERFKRTLIYPEPQSKIQMIYGIGAPVVGLKDVSITFGYVIKAQYFLPVNSTQILQPGEIIPPEEDSKRKRSVHTRWNIYKILSTFLERYGGKSCVLRSICEISSYNLDKSIGFFEEIFHVIFRPSTTMDVLSDAMDREYIAAETIGLAFTKECASIYSECTISLIDMLTMIK